MAVKRLTRSALLCAIALTIFMLELQIPSVIPIPGVKLGLANIVTLYSLFLLSPGETAAILLVRIVLGSIFGGNLMAMIYSLAGGFLCYLVMLLLKRLVSNKQLWVLSAFGAIAHNTGQIAVAILVTKTPELISYLPILMITGIAAGVFTGLCSQFLIAKLGKVLQDMSNKS